MKIRFRTEVADPEVLELTPMNRGHLQQLKNRLKKC
jgi:hypothetical protein